MAFRIKNITPVFPLNLVIFPGSVYPLHIFEERYKKMVHRVLNEGGNFGIVSKIDDTISNIGSLVNITRIVKKYENGAMDIHVLGLNRFQIVTNHLHDDGYLEARILPFEDLEETANDLFEADLAMDKFLKILSRTQIKLGDKYWKKLENTNLKSFKIAEKSGLNLKQQQEILTLQSETKRLNFLIEHFDKVDSYLNKTETYREIIMGDGYIN